MKIFRTAGAAAVLALAASASHASSITVSTFSITDFETLTNGWVIEDFEDTGTLSSSGSLVGTLGGDITSDLVGTFSSTGGTGTGSTCDTNNDTAGITSPGDPDVDCTTLARTPGSLNGQTNLVPEFTDPDDGFSLNSNDTTGIEWDVQVATPLKFNELAFAIQDPADQGATLVISADDGSVETFVISKDASADVQVAGNAEAFLVYIAFDDLITGATVTLLSSKTNDAISFDGASVNAVPLPAAAWLFGSALIGAGIVGRRKKKAA